VDLVDLKKGLQKKYAPATPDPDQLQGRPNWLFELLCVLLVLHSAA
jgi:hypothetical protein